MFSSIGLEPQRCEKKVTIALVIKRIKLFHRYANILNGAQCFCGSNTGSVAEDSCTVPCVEDATLTCGGNQSVSTYETGVLGKLPIFWVFFLLLKNAKFYFFSVATAPRSLTLLSGTENTLKVSWEQPAVLNGEVYEYHVTAWPVSSYSLESVFLPMEWTFPNNSLSVDLTGLQPGSQYNISVQAKTVEGYGTAVSGIYSTEIGGCYYFSFE